MFELLPLHSWVYPTYEQVEECQRVAWNMVRSGTDSRDKGVTKTLMWVNLGDGSPITGRLGSDDSYEHARAECWAALCVAAGQSGPAVEDWQRLGVEPKLVVTNDREFAYGAWRALTWLLGTRGEWPIHTAWHQDAEIPMERPHMLVPRSQRNTDAWRLADQASRDRAQQEALRHWQHIRGRVDVTA